MLGLATASQGGSTAIGGAVPGLTADEQSTFTVGRDIFRRTWQPHTEYYNARSCFQCHREPSLGGASGSGFDVAFFMPDPGAPTGFKPFPWLRWKGRPAGQRLPFGEFETRRPPALYGLGLLEAVPVEALLERADPSDTNKDGISGRLVKVDARYGRFGWRGSAPTVAAFVRGAFETEMGLRLNEGLADNQLSPEMVHLTADAVRFLAPPSPRPSAKSSAGRLLFAKIGCASCHTPELKTGYSENSALKEKTIAPFSDMLLHDIARGKAPVETRPQVSVREFRTPPLWGLGLSPGPYFHDGSTGSIEDAVDRHEGESLGARDKWRALSKADREALLAFLRSL